VETFESRFDNGISPDGKTEVTVLSQPGGVQEELSLRITDVKSGRLLGSHPFDGFSFALRDKPSGGGVFPRDAASCSWRADGRCVALSYVMTRGFVGTTVYAPWGNRWIQIPLPNIFEQIVKAARAAGEKRVSVDEEPGGKGHESRVKWLPHHRFRLEAGYRGIWVPNEEAEQFFWVTLRVIEARGKSKPKIVLEKIEFVPNPVPASH
jgi:hypothetical protein